MKHIIIGVGAAGIAAAKTIRKDNQQDEIVMIANDSHPLSRCMLHKYIGDERDAQGLSFVEEGFFDKHQIHFIPNAKVESIDFANKQVVFNQKSESYDRLLIATGATSFFPPIPGLHESKNTFGLRDLSDAGAIKTAAKQAQNIVVLGAGLVGLDATDGLLKLGKKVTVVEMATSVLSSNLDASAAQLYQEKFEAAGCTFALGVKMIRVMTDFNDKVEAVMLSDGRTLACDLLIVASGVRPGVEFLQGSSIIGKKGIAVDEYMATSEAGVYAAGDVTGLSETWPNAVLQGEVAAENMLGHSRRYEDDFALKNTINFFGITTLSVGQNAPLQGDVVEQRSDRHNYQKIILREGVPVGVTFQGDISRSGFWQHLIKNAISVKNIQKPLWKISFADGYEVAENGEYQWRETV